jgi:hypothetical protein
MYYKINSTGRHYVAQFVQEYGKEGLNVEPYYEDAEDAADDAFHRDMSAVIEIGVQMSYDGRPHTLTLEEAWFDDD